MKIFEQKFTVLNLSLIQMSFLDKENIAMAHSSCIILPFERQFMITFSPFSKEELSFGLALLNSLLHLYAGFLYDDGNGHRLF